MTSLHPKNVFNGQTLGCNYTYVPISLRHKTLLAEFPKFVVLIIFDVMN